MQFSLAVSAVFLIVGLSTQSTHSLAPCGLSIPIYQAFTVVLKTERSRLNGIGAVIKFDQVILNRGNGYRKSTGTFTARYSGLYQFSVSVMSDDGKDLNVRLYQNNRIILSLYGLSQHGSSESAVVVLWMKKGDCVNVRNKKNGISYAHGNTYSYMSGFYIGK